MMKSFVLILVAFVVSATAKNATLHMVAEPIKDQYIVVMKPEFDPEAFKKVLLSDVSGVFNETSIKHTYTKAIKGFSAKMTKTAVEKLLTRKEVKYIEQDGIVRTSAVASWGLDRIDQRELPLDGNADFKGPGGAGVNIYVIDTGIYPDSLYFEGRASVAYDSIQDAEYGIDCNGHGTHCAGTAGSSIYGVANKANIFGVKVLGCNGGGSFSNVIDGCDYVAGAAMLPAVASMSLGGGASQAIDDAVQGMINAGIHTVAAAGNSNDDACNYSPARGREVIAVGATDINDNRASFSNYGLCVDIFAPGVSIPSAWINGPEDTNTISGTSMSCPHVSGAIAVVLSRRPDITPQKMKKKATKRCTQGVVNDPQSDNCFLYLP